MKGISLSHSLNPSNFRIAQTSLLGYFELMKGLMQSRGWDDLSSEIQELDNKQHSQMNAFKAKLENYEAEKTPENAKSLLLGIESELGKLRRQYSYLRQLQQYYDQKSIEENHQNSSSLLSSFFYRGLENLRYFFDSTSAQLAARYQQTAERYQPLIKHLKIFKRELQQELRTMLTDNVEAPTDHIMEFQASVTSGCAGKREKLGGYNPLTQIQSAFPKAMQFYSTGVSNAYNPFVRTLYDSSLIIAWNTFASSTVNSKISAIRVDSQGYPGNSFDITTDSSTNHSNPTIAVFDNLQSIIAWDSGSTGSQDIYASCFSPGTSTGAPFVINSVSSSNNAYPAVATFENSFVIAWAQNSDSSNPMIKAKFYQASINYLDNSIACNESLAITDEIPLSTTQSYMSKTSVDITAAKNPLTGEGQYYFTWASAEGDVYVRPFSLQGVPLRAELKLDNVFPVPPKSKPLIEAKPDGNLLVVWRENFNTDSDIYAQLIYTQGSGKNFGFPMQTSFDIAPSYADENYPAIGAFSGGNFVSVWSISLGSNNHLDCIDFENEYCQSGLYARFFAGDETSIKNWYCIADNQSFSTRVVDSHLDTYSNGDFVLAATDTQSRLNYAIYQNQPPAWSSSAWTESEYTRSPLSLHLSNQLRSYDISGYIKDPEGGTVTCDGEINIPATGRPNNSTQNGIPLATKNLFLDKNTCILSSAALAEGLTTLNLQAYDPEEKEGKASLVLDVRDRLSDAAIAGIIVGGVAFLSFLIGYAIYKYKKYSADKENENFRYMQSPFANEVHACLNLAYERFDRDDGANYYKLVMSIIQQIQINPSIPIIDRYINPNPEADEMSDLTLDGLFYKNQDDMDKVRFYFYAFAVSKFIYEDMVSEIKTQKRSRCFAFFTKPIDKIKLKFEGDYENAGAENIVKKIAEAIKPATIEIKKQTEIKDDGAEEKQPTQNRVKWKDSYLIGQESTWIRECKRHLESKSYEKFRNNQRFLLRNAYLQSRETKETKSIPYSLFHTEENNRNLQPASSNGQDVSLNLIPT